MLSTPSHKVILGQRKGSKVKCKRNRSGGRSRGCSEPASAGSEQLKSSGREWCWRFEHSARLNTPRSRCLSRRLEWFPEPSLKKKMIPCLIWLMSLESTARGVWMERYFFLRRLGHSNNGWELSFCGFSYFSKQNFIGLSKISCSRNLFRCH